MKKADFLNKIRGEGKLKITEPSEEMKISYLQKAENCLNLGLKRERINRLKTKGI
ncbi:MAG: hypothetical protein AAB857_03135 [Patescibacteria group bacterium]